MSRTRKWTVITVLTLVALIAGSLGVAAQSGTWVSGIMIQNQSETDTANITVTFYWAEGEAAAGTVAHSFTDTIPASESKGYWVPSIAGLPDNFVGSAVVTSDQPVVANVNTQNTAAGTTSDPNRVGTASGVLDPGTSLYFTQVMKDYAGWNSYLAVQNTSGTQATVTVRYYNDVGGSEVAAAAETQTIKPYSTRIFRQADNANLSGSWGGSAVVSSDQPVAGICNFFNDGSSNTTAQFHSYNAFTGGGTKLYVPRAVVNYADYQSGLKVQNVGAAATNVTITYYFGSSTYSQTISGLQPSAASAVYLASLPQLAGISGSGSAVIESSGGVPIVATVNEDNRVGAVIAGHEGRGVTYNAFLDGSQSDTVFFSQVTSRAGGYSGGPQVQNVGTSATTVTAVWSMTGFTDVTVQKTLQPNESWSWFGPNVVTEKAGFNGSVVVTASEPLVGIANGSYWQTQMPADNWPANYGDSFLTYNGVNR